MRKLPVLAGLALALAAALPAQNCLTTVMTGTTTTTAGNAAVFDLSVANPVLISSISCNFSAALGANVGLSVWICPTTYVGNTTNQALWTQIANFPSGTVTAAGPGQPTVFTFSSPYLLAAGSYGVSLDCDLTSHRYSSTAATSYSDSFLTITMGAIQATPWTGTLLSPRQWNGTICYTPAAGLYPNFSATPTSGASPMNVAFTDTTFTSDPNGILTWSWDFENDGTPDAFVQNPTHTYTQPGLYSVKLSATDTLHGTQTFTRTNYISVDPVTANFTATPTVGPSPLLVNFTDTSTGLITSWAWDFDNDGITDSTVQNPTWLYINGGFYTVKLTVSNSGQSDVETKTNLIYVTPTPADPGTPDMLQYQFNEPRGNQVANSASTPLMAAFGTANNSTWHADTNRLPWQGNEPGFGCMGSLVANWVNPGWTTSHTGSLTIAFWMRRNPGSTTTNPFGYAFSNGTFRAFAAGAAGQGITFRGTAIGNVDSGFTVTGTPGVWQHVALVIDDVAGQARWWSDGAPSATVVNFTPGTFAYTGTTGFAVGANGTGGSSTFSTHYDMDDFRMYSRALTPGEIIGCLLQEKAAATTFGNGCAGPGGVPVIGSSGGAPFIGNGAFQVDVSNTEVGSPCAVLVGVFARQGGLPLDISFLLGAGCVAETLPDLGAFVVGVGPTGSLPLGIPPSTALAGAHLYAQALVFGSQGAASPALDINLQN